MVPVMTSTEGRWVAGRRPASSARHLGKPLLPRPQSLLPATIIQVRHLVDDDDDIRWCFEIELLLLVDRRARLLVVTGMDRARQRSPLVVASANAR